jgi:DNA-binding CsgD family transcriptional regulator
MKPRSKNWYEFQQLQGDQAILFIHLLASKYPSLTRTELQVCSMIRCGMESNEISKILNVTVHSIENHRSNIRSKLKLDHKQNLYTYLVGL